MKKALVFKPEYYDHFSCKGSECRNTCCGGWWITLSKEEYRKSKHLIQGDGAFPSREYFSKRPASRRSDKSYADVVLDEDQNCPFLTPERLCGLQCHFGKEALSDTCNWFPRRLLENYGLCCATLSPGCEKVLEMLPTDRSLTFSVSEEYLGEGFPKSLPIWQVYPKDKYPYAAYFQDIYSMCILILQAQDASLEDRVILLGIGLEKIIRLGKEGKWDGIPAYIDGYISTLSKLEDVSVLLPSISPNLSAVFNNFFMADNEPEGRVSAYQDIMNRVKGLLNISYEAGSTKQRVSVSVMDDYTQQKEAFGHVMADRPYFMENVLLSIFTYRNLPFSEDRLDGIWGNYIYLCWVYSSLKFILTVCHEDILSHEGLVSLCVPLLRRWVHNSQIPKAFVKEFKENSSDTLAHMAVLVKSC